MGVDERRQDHRVERLGGPVARLDRGPWADVDQHDAVERHRALPQGRDVRSGEHPGRGEDADGHAGSSPSLAYAACPTSW